MDNYIICLYYVYCILVQALYEKNRGQPILIAIKAFLTVSGTEKHGLLHIKSPNESCQAKDHFCMVTFYSHLKNFGISSSTSSVDQLNFPNLVSNEWSDYVEEGSLCLK